MTPEENKAFESLSPEERKVWATYALARTKWQEADRALARAKSDVERCVTALADAEEQFSKAAVAFDKLIDKDK